MRCVLNLLGWTKPKRNFLFISLSLPSRHSEQAKRKETESVNDMIKIGGHFLPQIFQYNIIVGCVKVVLFQSIALDKVLMLNHFYQVGWLHSTNTSPPPPPSIFFRLQIIICFWFGFALKVCPPGRLARFLAHACANDKKYHQFLLLVFHWHVFALHHRRQWLEKWHS